MSETSLKPNKEDQRFYHFIVGWARRYRRYSGRTVILGTDFIIDFPYKAIHPLTRMGKDFVAYVRGEFPRAPVGKKIERIG